MLADRLHHHAAALRAQQLAWVGRSGPRREQIQPGQHLLHHLRQRKVRICKQKIGKKIDRMLTRCAKLTTAASGHRGGGFRGSNALGIIGDQLAPAKGLRLNQEPSLLLIQVFLHLLKFSCCVLMAFGLGHFRRLHEPRALTKGGELVLQAHHPNLQLRCLIIQKRKSLGELFCRCRRQYARYS